MARIIIIYTLALGLAAAAAALADQDATYHGPESSAEKAFVSSIQADLTKRFPTAADAVRAGYVRYTGVDDTGAISYADFHWTSDSPKDPSQLWYDKNGKLLGADFSVPVAVSKARPLRWGIDPGRWVEFDGHVHWVTKDPATGTFAYDLWMPDAAFAAAGGNLAHPSAQTLVKLHKVANAADVTTIFHFPEIWDLIVWVKPNPDGAFAEKNPTVTP